jgi:uncharacterized membrane protein
VSGKKSVRAADLARVERRTSRLLFWGGSLSIAVAVAGLVLAVLVPGKPVPALTLADVRNAESGRPASRVFTAVGPILRGLQVGAHFDPLAVAALGLGLLLLTPLAGVAMAVEGFLVAGDYLYAAISAVVLLILIASLFMGGGHL